jgi:PPP family 3-phenylpropionic acid transporter
MRKNRIKIDLIYFFSFFADALFSPFLALYFISLDFDNFQRGILLSLIPFGAIIGNFIYGNLAKQMEKNVMIARIMVLINALVMVSFGFVKNFYLLIVLTLISSLHNNPYFSIQDGICVKICEEEHLLYSLIRIFGSIGYLMALILKGFIADLLPYRILFLLSGIGYLAIEFFYIGMKFPPNEQETNKISFKSVLTNKTFIKYAIYYLLVIGAWNIGEAYCSTYFNALGVLDWQWSFMYATQVFVEIVTIVIFSKYFKKLSTSRYLLFVSSLGMMTRYLILSLPLPTLVLIICSVTLRGFSWGLLISQHMRVVEKILGEDLSIKGVSLLALGVNIILIIGDLLAPYIIEGLSIKFVYLFLGLMMGLGLIAFLFIKFDFLKKE